MTDAPRNPEPPRHVAVETKPIMKLARLALLLPLFALVASADEIWPDAAALPAASAPKTATRDIEIGKGLVASAKFSITEKGNGGLEVPGLGLRVYDAQRDGVTFSGYLLRCEWKDVNGDGYLDLVVSGTAQYWRENGSLEIEKPITAVAHFDPARRLFTLVKTTPEIFSWQNRSTATARPGASEN